MKSFPKISIVTPSFNQGKFIEKTITSILNQKYPNLEYIVMYGGSSDNTLNILKKYRNRIIYTSRKDNGQSDALNMGFKKTTGEIVGFVNSDDYLEEGSLFRIGEFFAKNPEAYWVTGKCFIVDHENREVRKLVTLYKNLLLKFARFRTVSFVA